MTVSKRGVRPANALRVAVTRDEPPHGPLAAALVAAGLTPVSCPVLLETPPADVTRLDAAARSLDRYHWAIFSSARAVRAVAARRASPWPAHVRTAAVGRATAQSLVEHGASTPLVPASGEGADALWRVLAAADAWPGVPVLLPTNRDGGRALAGQLGLAGAEVTMVEAYRMEPRPAEAIRADWLAAAPQVVIVASSQVARHLVEAVGAAALASIERVVAIGPTTAATLTAMGIETVVATSASFTAVCRAAIDDRGGSHDHR